MFVVCILLFCLLFATRRTKGPIWIFCISWFLCILPIATGLISYNYFSIWDIEYAAVLTIYLLCYIAGVTLYNGTTQVRLVSDHNMAMTYRGTIMWVKLAWIASAVSTLCLIIDFVIYKGASLSDLSELRSQIVEATFASWPARIASVLIWGSLYCFAFAIFFREYMSRKTFLLILLPVAGFFLAALFSAGRQAALQIILIGLLIQFIIIARSNIRHTKTKIKWAFPAAISFLMVFYMGYVAINRNDGLVSTDKIEVIAALFDFTLSSSFVQFIAVFGGFFQTTFIEGLVYFTSPVALLSNLLTLEFPNLYAGVMSFPLIARQLQDFTGVSVVDVMNTNSQVISNSGVIGVGWTTAFSSYILDFGRVGAAIVLFLQGFYTAYAWRRALFRNSFHDVLIALVLLMLAVYSPLLAMSSDTNIFLLWFFCFAALLFRKRQVIKR